MNTQHSELIAVARKTLLIEAATLHQLAARLDQSSDFAESVLAIFHSTGRVVVTGIGKSAIVAQKVVATMNSTGTPSLFMHAADAIHGDLGMIQPNDIVICISKSGETPEIRALAPILKTRGNLLIAMTANPQSTLAYHADFILWTPVEQEADPNNLAPTASTTVQMALGDALSVALLSLRGFSQSDFAKFHPGGTLGKQLYLRVIDLCRLHEKPAVTESADIQTVIYEITSKRLGATAVLDDAQKIVGIITDGDLRRMLQKKMDFLDLQAKDIATRQPKTIASDEMATQALALLRKHSISQLLVVEGEKYLGMVHLHDLLREGIF